MCTHKFVLEIFMCNFHKYIMIHQNHSHCTNLKWIFLNVFCQPIYKSVVLLGPENENRFQSASFQNQNELYCQVC